MKFEFTGNWSFPVQLKQFAFLNHPDYVRNEETMDQVQQGIFGLQIWDEKNDNPDPAPEQLNTIHYILDETNQLTILQNLLEYSKTVIYPLYKTFICEEEYADCFPNLESIQDLRNLYSINFMTVNMLHKDGFAYYTLYLNSCLDMEHGLTITLYKDHIIDNGQEADDEKVCEHAGMDYHAYREKNMKEAQSALEWITPHPKYGKLKPWQESQNQYYPFGLFHQKQDELLIFNMELGNIPSEAGSRLLGMAIEMERNHLIEYFMSKKPKHKHDAFLAALKQDRYDLMNQLIEMGYDLNEFMDSWSPFSAVIDAMRSAMKHQQPTEKWENQLKYLIQKGLDPFKEATLGRTAFTKIYQIPDFQKQIAIENLVWNAIKERSER